MPILNDYERYLLARRRSLATIRLRLTYVRAFEKSCGDLTRATPAKLDTFYADHRDRWSDETMNVVTASLKGFYKWATATEAVDRDPTHMLEYLRISSKAAPIADDLALVRGLKRATLPQRALLLLMAEAGLRRTEAATLRVADREGDWITIKGKGGKVRSLPLTPALTMVLDELEKQGTTYYFPGRYGGHVSDGRVAVWVQELTGFTPHALRHRFATRVHAKTGDVRSVQLLLGHASLATTERYLHSDRETLQAVTMTASLVEIVGPETSLEAIAA